MNSLFVSKKTLHTHAHAQGREFLNWKKGVFEILETCRGYIGQYSAYQTIHLITYLFKETIIKKKKEGLENHFKVECRSRE